MKQTTCSAASNTPTKTRRATFEEGLRLRIDALIDEREVLMEEVRQLRAAVHIYSEVVRRLQAERHSQAA